METNGKIRRWRRVENLSISEIARRLGASRNTIKKYLKNEVTRPRYKQREKRYPVIGPWISRLALLLAQDHGKSARERRTGSALTASSACRAVPDFALHPQARRNTPPKSAGVLVR